MRKHPKIPSLRVCLAIAGGAIVTGAGLLLEKRIEAILILFGLLLLVISGYLRAAYRRRHPVEVTGHEAELSDTLSRMHSLFHATMSITLAQPADGILEEIWVIGSRILKSNSIVIFEAKKELKELFVRGVPEEFCAVMKESYIRRSGLFDNPRQDIIPISECLHDKRLINARRSIDSEKLRSLLFVPLISEGQTIGFLFLFYNRPHSITAEEVVVATAFGSQTSMAIRNGVLRHNLESALQEHRCTIDSTSDIVWMVDPAMKCVSINHRAEELTGRKSSDWLHREFSEFVAEPDRPLFEEKILATLAGRPHKFDIRLLAGSRLRTLTVKTSAIYSDSDVMAVLGVGRDVTEERELAAQLLQLHNAGSIESLAGGMARVFGNSLSAILGHVSLARLTVPVESPECGHFDAIEKSARRVGDLANHLLGFTRRCRRTHESFDFNVLLKETVSLIEHELDPAIDIQMDLCPDVLSMAGDPAQVQRIIIHLIQNAVAAVRGDDRIWIRSLWGGLDDRLARKLGMSPGRCIIFGVRDTGQWPNIESLSSIFMSASDDVSDDGDAHRSLSMINEIVKSLGGAMRASSVNGQGATFTVCFPSWSGTTMPSLHPALTDAIQTGSHNEMVLVVDEDPDMREVICEALHHSGYSTSTAGTLTDAAGVLDAHPGLIDLIILDFSGLRAGEADAADRLCSRLERPPVILLSGSHLHKEAVLKIAACVSSFVDKPLFLGDLLTQVHDLLRDAHKGREASSDQSLCPITEEKVIVGVVEDQHALIKSAE